MTCFETFPFPRPTDAQREAIAEAARELDRLRNGWLNPPGLEPAALAKRTLTNLYNERPTWLGNVHARLDAAVLDAYGWPMDLLDDEVLAGLLELNLSPGAGLREAPKHSRYDLSRSEELSADPFAFASRALSSSIVPKPGDF